MARPIKKGLDYYPKSVDFYHKQINRVIYNDLGIYALVLYDFILCYIYENNGYYTNIDKVFWSIVKDCINLKREEAEQIIKCLIENDVFDGELYEKYSILTSAEIQKTYITAKRKKADVIEPEYCLIEEINTVSAEKTEGFCCNNPLKKSKEKESKENHHQSKEKKSINNLKDDNDDDLKAVAEVFEKNIAAVSPAVIDEMKKWLTKVNTSFITDTVNESAKHGAKTWKYVDTALNNKYNFKARHPDTGYEVDENLGF